jgi:MerR family mercuric resistance operon transcriptional regulator
VPGREFEDDFLTIGELSRHAGVKVETIRYYERIRLMPRPSRSAGGHRLYAPDDLRTLTFIKRSRELGFGLEDIRALLVLRRARGRCADVKSIANRHLVDVRAKMRVLVELEKVLSAMVARCPGDETTDCPVLDILDVELPERRPRTPAAA